MADMNGHDAIVRVYNQFANARHHMVGLPWSYTCVPASVQAVQVSFARKDGKRATEKKNHCLRFGLSENDLNGEIYINV